MTGYAIVSTTIGGEAEARTLARTLIEQRLGACVQIVPITSVYRWDGAIEEASEQLLFCKIADTDYPQVEAAIHAVHPYDVPEIVMTPITAGHAPYLAWLGDAVRR